MTIARISVVTVLALLIGIASAGASPLGPSKPSQIVTAFAALGGTPNCPSNILTDAFQVSSLRKSDGTSAPFVIPPKSVLVVTSFDFGLFSLPGNNGGAFDTIIVAVDPSQPDQFGAFARGGGTSSPINGELVGNVTIPNGLVVKPPAILCARSSGSNLGAIVIHGFFTKDK
jgi:hypothetical protein